MTGLVKDNLYFIVRIMIDTLDKPPTRRELSKRNRRAAIVQAARASFIENGYAGTSMSGLLDTLGGSKQTLWNYFRSKEELFAAVMEDVTVTFRAELASHLFLTNDVEQGLLHFAESFLLRLEADDAIAAWRLVAAESARFPEVGRIFYERAVQMTEQALATFLSRFVEDGSLRDEGPLRMAQLFLGLCTSRQNRRLWGVEPSGADEVHADAARYTGLFLRAYRTSPAAET